MYNITYLKHNCRTHYKSACVLQRGEREREKSKGEYTKVKRSVTRVGGNRDRELKKNEREGTDGE